MCPVRCAEVPSQLFYGPLADTDGDGVDEPTPANGAELCPFRCPDGSEHSMWEPSPMRSQSQCYRTFALEVSKRHRTLAPESSQRHRLVRRRRAWELVVLEKVLNRYVHVSVQVSMM